MKFFTCGKCGFRNHPRHPQQGKPDVPTDDEKCEQCGTPSSGKDAHPDTTAYAP